MGISVASSAVISDEGQLLRKRFVLWNLCAGVFVRTPSRGVQQGNAAGRRDEHGGGVEGTGRSVLGGEGRSEGQPGDAGADDGDALGGVDAGEELLGDGCGDVGIDGDVGQRRTDPYCGGHDEERPVGRGAGEGGKSEAGCGPGQAAGSREPAFGDAGGEYGAQQVPSTEHAESEAVAADALTVAVGHQERHGQGESRPGQLADSAQDKRVA